MSKNVSIEIAGKIVELLTPLESEERQRVITASFALLGEALIPVKGVSNIPKVIEEETDTMPIRTRAWMKQYGLSLDDIQQVFHIANGEATVIAAAMPGNNKREQTYNAYVLSGIAKLLATGDPSFDDKIARALCESSGCYDSANHSATLKDRGNEFTGSKDKGWTLTSPGLKRGADLIQGLNK